MFKYTQILRIVGIWLFAFSTTKTVLWRKDYHIVVYSSITVSIPLLAAFCPKVRQRLWC